MISLKEFKDALGSMVNELTEEEILKLRENQDQTAEILFNMWLKDREKKTTKINKDSY